MDALGAVKDVYAEWERGNLGAGLDLYAPDLILEVHNPIPDAGLYEGREGLQRYMRGFLTTWEDYEIRGVAFEQEEERVIVDVHHSGKARGVSVDIDYVTVWSFRGDSVIRVDIGRYRDIPLEAARAAVPSARD